MELKDHYTKKMVICEPLDSEDFILLSSHVDFIALQGDIRHAKVTSVKTWKTKPIVRIGLKYGLYEYGTTEFNLKTKQYSGVQLVKKIA